jgi:hypothetical protein
MVTQIRIQQQKYDFYCWGCGSHSEKTFGPDHPYYKASSRTVPGCRESEQMNMPKLEIGIMEMAEGIERMTEGRISGDHAVWHAEALRDLVNGTYDPNDWVYVEELGFRIRKSELHRVVKAS